MYMALATDGKQTFGYKVMAETMQVVWGQVIFLFLHLFCPTDHQPTFQSSVFIARCGIGGNDVEAAGVFASKLGLQKTTIEAF